MKIKNMISLGIESTAHTFAVGIVNEKGEILSDIRSSVKTEPGKGFIPRELEKHHIEEAPKVLRKALEEANLSLEDVDVVSFSRGMGIPNALKVGAVVARYLSLKYKKPLIGVNHGVAHIEIGKLTTGAKDPVIVYTSGGNTQIISFLNKRYRIFGETEDITIGNAFDSLARLLGFPMPGGPKIAELASKGKKYITLPYVVKGMDVSFSGILTEVEGLLKKGENPEDVCFSFQETVFAMLVEVTERALAHTEKEEVLLVGGVAANKRFQQMMKIMCEDRSAKLYAVDQKYSGDNGVMIAWTGLLEYLYTKKSLPIENNHILQKWRIDEVEIPWLD